MIRAGLMVEQADLHLIKMLANGIMGENVPLGLDADSIINVCIATSSDIPSEPVASYLQIGWQEKLLEISVHMEFQMVF